MKKRKALKIVLISILSFILAVIIAAVTCLEIVPRVHAKGNIESTQESLS